MVDYYPVGPQATGHDLVALAEFGGEIGDPVGTALRVDGWYRVSIIRPRRSTPIGDKAYAKYQDAVRQLALTYDFVGCRGTVDIVWKPAHGGSAKRYDVPGEPVNRLI
jgi:hypothetical protein